MSQTIDDSEIQDPLGEFRGGQNLEEALAKGGRLVYYEYCISLIFITLRRPTQLVLLKPGEVGIVRGLPYSLISLLLGWWGLPWGLIYTPLTLVTNLKGGCEVTDQVKRNWLKKSP